MFIVSYSLWLNFFHLLAQKPNLEKISIYSNKFFHNFHLSKSSFTCPGLGLQVGGLARRLKLLRQCYHISISQMLLTCSTILSEGHILTSVAFMMSQLLSQNDHIITSWHNSGIVVWVIIKINVREYRRGNQKRTIQRNWQHSVHNKR